MPPRPVEYNYNSEVVFLNPRAMNDIHASYVSKRKETSDLSTLILENHGFIRIDSCHVEWAHFDLRMLDNHTTLDILLILPIWLKIYIE